MKVVLIDIGMVVAGATLGAAFGLLSYAVRHSGRPDEGLFNGRDNWKFHTVFGGLIGTVAVIVGIYQQHK
jgi:hypothetical protein